MPDPQSPTQAEAQQPQPIPFLPEDYGVEQDDEILRLTQEVFDLRQALRIERARVRTLEKVKQALLQASAKPAPDEDGDSVADPADDISEALDQDLGDPALEEKKTA